MHLETYRDVFRLAKAFTISRGSRTEAVVVRVEITDNGMTGRGECVPYARYGETVESVTEQIRSLSMPVSREQLQTALPAGAARNAVDCALWDLEAKLSGKRAWQLAGLAAPQPETTAFTLSLDTPDNMREEAAANAHRPLLKIKLGGEGDIARIEAVRAGAPEARIIVDANEGWTPEIYNEMAPVLLRLGVEMVEQPLPAASDDALLGLERILPVCADESCHDRASLSKLAGKYDIINIKLDKTGGLTEALELKKAALEAGYGVMVGCMVGSSLAMAPAVLVAQHAAVVDLDGPLLLAEDRSTPIDYDAGKICPPAPELWG
ncbi:dipeptide epimerase [Desulfovibrio subterraneus]|jgi:L-alanine-DL-glutamate epimerase-like enolase superfamily enzyme|uniref:N-acetyl-D-Glu racemase DgcA n=1 Tax=Desulfovibrio subterraneus TaxID=2718620 RepID=UPI0022B885E5|nr:N-acetyl-D-Glu racemase DgcA [Desulfovibrio subterraneus]WBF68884.1 dipeptide epimerase [Desulfovibrio subterraneus]